MFRKGVLLIAFLVPAFASTSDARADMCFQYGSGGGVTIAIGAKVPPINTCTPVSLVEQIYGGRLGLATGSICRVRREVADQLSCSSIHTTPVLAPAVTSSRRLAVSTSALTATSPRNPATKTATVTEYTPA